MYHVDNGLNFKRYMNYTRIIFIFKLNAFANKSNSF